jgi:hypothetical protein
MKATDINIIVSRQGYTQKSFFAYFNEIYSAQKNKNMAVILNDVNLKNAAYGMGGYGYGYYEEDHKANLWQKMFQKQKV